MKQVLTNLGSTEAQVQAEFYHRMRLKKIPVYLNEPMPSPFHRSGTFMPDALVGKPISCAIEFKRGDRKKPSPNGRQPKAYNALGVPWRYCNGIEDLDETIEWAINLLKESDVA